ncbi:hypothetical protein GCM10012289_49070 [Nonomuraea cavernae]|uniref:NYN domain-containing protein n=1 Tax=Nonomuraea cavernae TaxID=2045107 RepID=A0A917Z4E8_9ACTN|nr:hypothetical protein GCM10012289_49070 [Nonomuraea cavernae]
MAMGDKPNPEFGRVGVYIDGFNLYYGLRELGRRRGRRAAVAVAGGGGGAGRGALSPAAALELRRAPIFGPAGRPEPSHRLAWAE